ncbi:MAG: hypothetical protein ACP5JN_03845 [Candidatus Micrarchaeia archaeon]
MKSPMPMPPREFIAIILREYLRLVGFITLVVFLGFSLSASIASRIVERHSSNEARAKKYLYARRRPVNLPRNETLLKRMLPPYC